MPLDMPVLLAKIASARSDLLWSVAGLDEAALASLSADGRRTFKDILAHVASWETWTAEHLRMVAAGRSAELPRTSTDSENLRVLAERWDWPVCRVLAELTNAHAVLVYQAERWTAEAPWPAGEGRLDARYLAPWPAPDGRPGGTVRPARWLEMSREHDVRHAAEITAWRQAAGRSAHGSGPGCLLVAALEASREELLAWAGLLDEPARPVCGVWTVRDVLGHVADWDTYMAKALGQMAAGQMGGDEYDDLESWNTSHASARQGQSGEQVTADLAASRAGVLAALAPLSDPALCAPAASRWNAEDSAYGMAHVSLEHDRDHARGLREAVGRG